MLSARLGHDPLLTQAAGGNTSIKLDGVMWVKASGLWLAAAAERPSFVPIDLATGQQHATGDAALDRLRPSIETSMHAVIPQAVVLHLHAVATIAWAVQQDARALVAEKLDGLAWAFVDYVRPGLPLCHAIEAAIAERQADVFIMGNHGLTVAAADCASALALLEDVERRLAIAPRSLPAANVDRLALAPGYRPPRDARCHRLAATPDISALAVQGSLYPDHAVFLGRAIAMASGDRVDARKEPPLVLIVPGQGVLVSTDISEGAEAMLLALMLVLERLPPQAPLVWLPHAEVDALSNWEAERYRRSLDAARAATTA